MNSPTKKHVPVPEIREYLDFRAYLRDAYQARHSNKKGFNYAYLCTEVGLKSAGHITSILNGSRNISTTHIDAFARVFHLSGPDTEYFRHLIAYCQATKHEVKERAFLRLSAYHRSDRRLIDPRIYRYFSHWYNPVVRELVALTPVRPENAHLLGKLVRPRISPAAAREAVALLAELGLIRTDETGTYERVDTILTTGEGWHSLTINTYQRAAMVLAQEALERIPREERDISTLTLSVSCARLPLLRERLDALRSELLALATEEQSPDCIYQCNIQLFPVSAPPKGSQS